MVRREWSADGERRHHPRVLARRGPPLEQRVPLLRRRPRRHRRLHDAPPGDAQLARQQRQAGGGTPGK